MYWLGKGFILYKGGIIRSRHGIRVNFDKIYVFYGKYCVRIDKCVFIIIKIKYMNSCRISDICNKVNFITKLYTFYDLINILSKQTQYFIKTYTNIIIFYTFNGTVRYGT